MSFVYPAGLWSLLGVGVLILVYLIRKKYDTTVISSTYLWHLAEQYRKKNRTVQRMKKALLFALQFLCVAIAGLMIAQPMVLLPGADMHYVAILDGSASMRITGEDGKTRFVRAAEAIAGDASALPWGSSVTVILAGDEAVVLADHVSGSDVRRALENAQCGWGAGDLPGAMAIGQELFDRGAGTRACLYTDKEYTPAENMEVTQVRGEKEWNVSVSALEAEGSIYGTLFTCGVVSDGRDAGVTVELYLGGEKQDESMVELRVNGQIQEGASVFCPDSEMVEISLLARQVYDYSDVRVAVLAEDGMTADNEYRLYRSPEKTTRALLVGEKAYFLKSVLSVFAQLDLETAKTPQEAAAEGYDLYVYDGCLPEKTPQDGALWMINPPRAPRESGVVFGDELMGTYISAVREFADEQLYTLTRDLTLRDAAVVRFREITSSGRFAPVLLCGSYPVLLCGRTQDDSAQLIMPFDLQDSNLPLLSDYVVLISNMLAFSVPPLLEEQDVECGVRLYPHVHPQCEKLFMQTPDMSIRTLEAGAADDGLLIASPGGYTMLQELRGGKEQILDFFAHVPEGESRLDAPAESLTQGFILREQESGAALQPETAYERHLKPLRMLAAILLLLLIVEWVVYQREKY